MNCDGLRKVPQHAPLGFIRRRWEAYVLGTEGIDRRFYELCVMTELKNSLRSGDVSVAGSRQFRDFEDHLMPHPEFNRRLTQGELHVDVPTTGAAYLEERMSLLRNALDQTNALAREDKLPDAELNSAGIANGGERFNPMLGELQRASQRRPLFLKGSYCRSWFCPWPLSLPFWLGMPGRTGVPSILTASSELGSRPKSCRMVGATCIVSTQLVMV
jgi:hypothetical protein